MTPDTPNNRRHSHDAEGYKTVFVQFTTPALPPDHPDAPKGERHGRPARSPSLPPEEPDVEGAPPAG